MAKKIVTTITDDLDGKEADETVAFALDGKTYEIDLSNKNAKKLRAALAPFAEAGRKVGRGGKPKAASAGRNNDTAQIREWAKVNGYEVNDRGRVSATVREAYEKANT
ncbi:histone-like nucleoid-structuring protein Lsr2 [Streptomyces uncialis]|uniref:Lsr2-like protein n=1 Tax=Streptomyces uncialis TaxID=1048205 RepID=A0A1Q4VC31_9ACTN|nr:Lsr2 family protein [Streptomyces uncialis]OKH95404.1 hypothetical protein AB852_00575 [Streptomyces uncialis]